MQHRQSLLDFLQEARAFADARKQVWRHARGPALDCARRLLRFSWEALGHLRLQQVLAERVRGVAQGGRRRPACSATRPPRDQRQSLTEVSARTWRARSCCWNGGRSLCAPGRAAEAEDLRSTALKQWKRGGIGQRVQATEEAA
jgi:hypothetical protein